MRSALQSQFAALIGFVLALTACCRESDIPKARQKLYSPAAKDRNDGAQALALCGSKAAPAVPKLIELLYDENVGVQSSSAYALRKIDTPEAREALERATKHRR